MKNGKKIAIIGASYLQEPLIRKAKNMGLETHVFAWKANDVGEKIADYFYPISIIEKEKILQKCKEIKIDGICSIGSDLAVITVNYVAINMGLIGNTIKSSINSTNKLLMKDTLKKNNNPTSNYCIVDVNSDIECIKLNYPLIVKPTDRSGSRGVYKLNNSKELKKAIELAIDSSFEKKAIIEEFVEGKEYSVEYISWEGYHYFVALTEKYTTGEPNFIETGHKEPAIVSKETLLNIKKIVEHALTSLDIKYGASHSEIKIDINGNINIIEIGARMGGDMIGSSLVQLSTGYDYVKEVINIALNMEPSKPTGSYIASAVIKFEIDRGTTDSSNRKGYSISTFPIKDII